jgi:two-component system, OmpR family, phosphate regulon sensor histidine kinase PhoR
LSEAITSDKETCRKLEDTVGSNEIRKTDSLFTNYMNYYNLHLDYSFEVKKPDASVTANEEGLNGSVYQKRLEEAAIKNGLELNLFLPEKKQFIVEEMGTMFITSVLLILVVLFMFWRTVQSLEKEKALSEHTTDFLNNMTHEFKTPLANISLAGNMIMKNSGGKIDEKVKHYSGIILEENEKLRLQVESVLSMTALERGEIPLHKSETDFHEIINDSSRYMALQIEAKNGELIKVLQAERHLVMGDKTHLTNAMRNLIDNAIKYSNGKPELTISTYNSGLNLMIVVTDKGIGIEKGYHQKVFDKYFRVPTGDVHDVKGFGLGLTYIKKIIELHDGTIEIHSKKNTGTSIIISIPYVEEKS